MSNVKLRRWLLLAALFLFCEDASAQIAFVQTTDLTSANPAATSITTSAFGSAVTSGNLLVAFCSLDTTGSNVSSITDTAGNTYVQAVTDTESTVRGDIWYAKNVTGGSGITITCNYNQSTSFRKIQANEYSGLDIIAPLDVTAFNSSPSSTNATSGTAATNVADELIVGLAVHFGIASYTPGTSFTVRGTQNFFGVEDRIVSATGTYEANWTNAADGWVALMATFKIAATTTFSGKLGGTAKIGGTAIIK